MIILEELDFPRNSEGNMVKVGQTICLNFILIISIVIKNIEHYSARN